MLKMCWGFLSNRKGDTNTVGWIVLLVFIILAVAPNIEAIGNTMATAVTNLNNDLTTTLGE